MGWSLGSDVRFGQSLLRISHPATVQKSADLLVDSDGAADMLVLALARSRALSLEGPHKADGLAIVLGDLIASVALQHSGDAGECGVTEATHESTVGVSIESGHCPGLRAGGGSTSRAGVVSTGIRRCMHHEMPGGR